MIEKVCVSGPAASGKTHFIENYLAGQLTDITILSESARKVSEMYPAMAKDSIEIFRNKVCEIQRQRETIVENLMEKGILICDRGIFDNLAFLFLCDRNRFNKELSLIINIYKNGIIKQYDYIFYFDVDLLTGGPTPLLKKALDDPLRRATINVENYARHAADFRNAFIEVTGYFRNVKVVPITAKPHEEGFNERNMLVKDYILYARRTKNNVNKENI